MTDAVDHRRVAEVLGKRHEGLAEQKDAEGAGEEGHDEALIRVQPAERVDRQAIDDDRGFEGDEQRGEEHDEQHVPARKPQHRKGVGGQQRRDDLADRDEDCDDQRVEQVAAETTLRPGITEHVEGERLGDERVDEHTIAGLQGRHDRGVDRKQDDEGDEREQAVASDQPEPRAAFPRRRHRDDISHDHRGLRPRTPSSAGSLALAQLTCLRFAQP